MMGRGVAQEMSFHWRLIVAKAPPAARAKRIVSRLALTSDEPALGRFFNAQGNRS